MPILTSYAHRISIAAQTKTLYESGMTQREIAATLGVGRATVCRLMQEFGIPARKAIKRDQLGENNPRWKGDQAGYKALHRRVHVALGRANVCVKCGSTDARKTYDWANISGQYADIDDYQPMCRSCHQVFDWERRRSG